MFKIIIVIVGVVEMVLTGLEEEEAEEDWRRMSGGEEIISPDVVLYLVSVSAADMGQWSCV